MNMEPRIITERGRRFAVIAMEDYERLREDAEMLHDIALYDRARERLDSAEEEILPWELTKALAGANLIGARLKLWRDYRGLTQLQLAKASGIKREMISQMESGQKNGAIATLKKLAKALRISLDDLVV
jgi:DNA-binding XRE family transcriptional regulator